MDKQTKQHAQPTAAKPSAPTFEVYTKQGYLKPHLKRAFLETVGVSCFDLLEGFIEIKDGSEWRIVIEAELKDLIQRSSASIRCIASCQEDWIGYRVAVLKLYKPKETQTQKEG